MPERRQIALLRGINLGSNRRVSMAALRQLLTELGYSDVRTHLQSGNILLTSAAAPATLQRKLQREIASNLRSSAVRHTRGVPAARSDRRWRNCSASSAWA